MMIHLNNKQRKVHWQAFINRKPESLCFSKCKDTSYFASSSELLSYCPLLPIRHITYVFDIFFWVI